MSAQFPFGGFSSSSQGIVKLSRDPASRPLAGDTGNVIGTAPTNPEQAQILSSPHAHNEFVPAAQQERKRQRAARSRSDVVYPRKRATAACNLCRSRKIKCNNARPSCSSCTATGAVCVYGNNEDQSRYVQNITSGLANHANGADGMIGSFDPASILILDRLNQVLSRLDRFDTHAISSPETGTIADSRIADTHIGTPSLQGQANQLKIPSRRTTPDDVLQWPIFQKLYPPNYLSDAVFEAENCEDDLGPDASTSCHQLASKPVTRGINEDEIPLLVQRFLELVHIKNPILDAGAISAYARHAAEFGLGWEPSSCLVVSTLLTKFDSITPMKTN